MKAIKADSKGRITLGKESAGREFVVTPAQGGYRVTAVKTVTVPEDEAWLWENPDALRAVLKGIEESKAGKATYLGSFAEYADVDLDEPESGH
jgi:hypothetical protein